MIASLFADAPLVDLIANPPNPGEYRPVTYQIGGRPFHLPPSPRPTLPVDIELQSTSPCPDSPLRWNVEITIRNPGPKRYMLPIGRDGDRALKPANRGRRELAFRLRARNERESSISGPSTFASTEVPESLLAIPPGGAVRVRFAAELSDQKVSRWRAEGKSEIEVWTDLTDYRHEDDSTRHFVNVENSPTGLSTNTIRLKLPELP